MRSGLCRDLGFSSEARTENIRRIAEVAKLLNDAGLIVIVAAISPLESDRAQARTIVGSERFFEIYVKADLETCIGRDPKGLYARALRGEISNFTGISADYNPPTHPALVIETGQSSLVDSLALFKSFLIAHAGKL
jgi:adenylylsulfate kinase